MLRPIWSAALISAVLVILAGCSLIPNTAPSPTETVGIWQRGKTDETITIYASGRITFENIPVGIVEGEGTKNDAKTKPITETGTWINFSNYEGYGPKLEYTVNGDSELMEWKGNDTSSRRLVLEGGNYLQFVHTFHRISTTP